MRAMMKRQWRRPSAFALTLTVAAIAIFIRLGIWQLDRAATAQALLASFDSAPQAAIEPFAAVATSPPADRFPHVRVDGHFLAGRGYLRDEQVRDGVLGVQAYAAIAVTGESAVLLVDRGWIAKRGAGSSPIGLPPLPEGSVSLTGIYAPFPGNGLRVGGDALRQQTAWPKLTLAIDPDAIAADLQQPLLPRVLLLDADAASGFARAWTPSIMPPERHRAYAFQWFAFAFAAAVIFVLRHVRKVGEPASQDRG